MLFNSPEFIVFLIAVYALYHVLKFRAQNYMLLAASYIFYGWWDWRFLFLMIFSTTIDYWIGLTMEHGRLSRREKLVPLLFMAASAILLLGFRTSAVLHEMGGDPTGLPLVSPEMPIVLAGVALSIPILATAYHFLSRLEDRRRRYACLLISLCVQLGMLSVFKYFNFFADSLETSLGALGFDVRLLHLNVILPVGISFYTFQSLSYAIDIYRREIIPTRRYLDFALFVAFFPQLVAGPIERARHLIPQLSNPRTLTYDDTTRGLYLILFGLFKKVAIADGVAPSVDQIFNSSGTVSWIDVVAGTLLFAIQIYCDFSGYSDIARGVAKLFGVDLMVNFNQPYFAKNPREFWQRWHISLSTWLSDYLYKPLGGNRGTLAFTCRNLMITMLLGGLWHGAAWNYVLWGFYHGTLLSIHRVWTASHVSSAGAVARNWLVNAVRIGFFFLLTLYGWLLFRAHSFDDITRFTGILFTDFGNLDYGAATPRLSAILGTMLLVIIELVQYGRSDPHFYRKLPLPLLGLFLASMVFLTFMGMSNEPAQFIYFQF
jgi:alginate O-acetyltransferase complex protein AlgI